MEEVRAGILSQAEKATNITCAYGTDLDGRTVDHYSVDYAIYNTGKAAHSEYWIDADTRFVWRDVTEFEGDPAIVITVDAEPAPDMALPDPKS